MDSRSGDFYHERDELNEERMELSNQPSLISQHKRQRRQESISAQRDLNWVRSLLLPSMAQQFVKFEVVSVISSSKTTLLCQLNPCENNYFSEYSSILGYFNIWWWDEMLNVVEKSHINNICHHFPFLKRIQDKLALLVDGKLNHLLLCGPKFVVDRSNQDQLLVTCKKFLIID